MRNLLPRLRRRAQDLIPLLVDGLRVPDDLKGLLPGARVKRAILSLTCLWVTVLEFSVHAAHALPSSVRETLSVAQLPDGRTLSAMRAFCALPENALMEPEVLEGRTVRCADLDLWVLLVRTGRSSAPLLMYAAPEELREAPAPALAGTK